MRVPVSGLDRLNEQRLCFRESTHLQVDETELVHRAQGVEVLVTQRAPPPFEDLRVEILRLINPA
jgi:hypothetical protein